MCFDEVIIKGGLGNQLFCLLFAYKILLSKKKVHLNLKNYSFFKRQDRKFVLDKLFPEIFDIFGNSNSYLSYFRFLYAKIFEIRLRKIFEIVFSQECVGGIKFWLQIRIQRKISRLFVSSNLRNIDFSWFSYFFIKNHQKIMFLLIWHHFG